MVNGDVEQAKAEAKEDRDACYLVSFEPVPSRDNLRRAHER